MKNPIDISKAYLEKCERLGNHLSPEGYELITEIEIEELKILCQSFLQRDADANSYRSELDCRLKEIDICQEEISALKSKLAKMAEGLKKEWEVIDKGYISGGNIKISLERIISELEAK